jgi:hypothetical protein
MYFQHKILVIEVPPIHNFFLPLTELHLLVAHKLLQDFVLNASHTEKHRRARRAWGRGCLVVWLKHTYVHNVL